MKTCFNGIIKHYVHQHKEIFKFYCEMKNNRRGNHWYHLVHTFICITEFPLKPYVLFFRFRKRARFFGYSDLFQHDVTHSIPLQ